MKKRAKISLPYLHQEWKRGHIYYYFRRPYGKRIRICGAPGTPAFQLAYNAALEGRKLSAGAQKKAVAGSFSWLAAEYLRSAEFAALAKVTQKNRKSVLNKLLKTDGGAPLAAITADTLKNYMAQLSGGAARHFFYTFSGLYKWAQEKNYAADITAGLKTPKQLKTKGHLAWTEDDVRAYERFWPLGTKERVWLAVLLYTGARAADAAKLGDKNLKNGIIHYKTQKSRDFIEVQIPIFQSLANTLAAGGAGRSSWICGSRGAPLRANSFSRDFSEAAQAAGIEKKTAHGVRKLMAIRLARANVSVKQTMSMIGWLTPDMALYYAAQAENSDLAREGFEKLSSALAQPAFLECA